VKRIDCLKEFYRIVDALARSREGFHLFSETTGRLSWPERGVYFIFDPNEARRESGEGMRVVRVGTHALTSSSRTRLWTRLRQHRGNSNGLGGNHRGSIFRLLVGEALMFGASVPSADTWGQGASATSSVREREKAIEERVSQYIGQLLFIVLGVPDSPGPESLRGFIERNSIALLSNFRAECEPLDIASPGWLGRCCPREKVQKSGLWNNNHVEEQYDPVFLDTFERLARAT
jgi:hypothetical protein